MSFIMFFLHFDLQLITWGHGHSNIGVSDGCGLIIKANCRVWMIFANLHVNYSKRIIKNVRKIEYSFQPCYIWWPESEFPLWLTDRQTEWQPKYIALAAHALRSETNNLCFLHDFCGFACIVQCKIFTSCKFCGFPKFWHNHENNFYENYCFNDLPCPKLKLTTNVACG